MGEQESKQNKREGLSPEVKEIVDTLENLDIKGYAGDSSGKIVLNLRNVAIIVSVIISIIVPCTAGYVNLKNNYYRVDRKLGRLEKKIDDIEETVDCYSEFQIKFDNKYKQKLNLSVENSKKNKKEISYLLDRIEKLHNDVKTLQRNTKDE